VVSKFSRKRTRYDDPRARRQWPAVVLQLLRNSGGAGDLRVLPPGAMGRDLNLRCGDGLS